jgi:hypothetical protein
MRRGPLVSTLLMHAWYYDIALAVGRSAVRMAMGARYVIFVVLICRDVEWWRRPTCSADAWWMLVDLT